MVTEIKHPASSHYSDRYQRDLGRAWLDMAVDLKRGLPISGLVWRARHAYREAWKRELLRHRESA